MRTHAAVEVAWQIRNGHTEKLGNGSFAYLPSANPRKIIVEAIPTKSHRLPTALPKGKTRLAPSTSIVAPTAPLMTSAQLIECFRRSRPDNHGTGEVTEGSRAPRLPGVRFREPPQLAGIGHNGRPPAKPECEGVAERSASQPRPADQLRRSPIAPSALLRQSQPRTLPAHG
jgi:hypothetical protein